MQAKNKYSYTDHNHPGNPDNGLYILGINFTQKKPWKLKTQQMKRKGKPTHHCSKHDNQNPRETHHRKPTIQELSQENLKN